MQVPGGHGVTCLGRAIATSVVSLLIEPAHDRRCRVEVFEQQQGQECIGCGLHTVELLARLLPALPVCGENPHPAPHAHCSVRPGDGSEKAQKKTPPRVLGVQVSWLASKALNLLAPASLSSLINLHSST